MESYAVTDLHLTEDSPILDLLSACPEVEPLLFHEGEYLVREGEDSGDTFLVVHGGYVVETSLPDTNDEKREILTSVLSTEDDPSFVGEMAYLGGEFRTASVRSVGATYTFCLKPSHVDMLIAEFPFFTRILCRQFTKRLTEANELLKIYRQGMVLQAEQRFLKAGEILLRRGERAETLFQLVRGKLIYEPDSAEVKPPRPDLFSGFVEPAEFFRAGVWKRTVLTETNAVVIAIDGESRLAVIRNYPEVAVEILRRAT